jgi:hypothetical protein
MSIDRDLYEKGLFWKEICPRFLQVNLSQVNLKTLTLTTGRRLP